MAMAVAVAMVKALLVRLCLHPHLFPCLRLSRLRGEQDRACPHGRAAMNRSSWSAACLAHHRVAVPAAWLQRHPWPCQRLHSGARCCHGHPRWHHCFHLPYLSHPPCRRNRGQRMRTGARRGACCCYCCCCCWCRYRHCGALLLTPFGLRCPHGPWNPYRQLPPWRTTKACGQRETGSSSYP